MYLNLIKFTHFRRGQHMLTKIKYPINFSSIKINNIFYDGMNSKELSTSTYD